MILGGAEARSGRDATAAMIWVALGVPIGLLFDNIGMGIAIGLIFAIAMGAFSRSRDK